MGEDDLLTGMSWVKAAFLAALVFVSANHCWAAELVCALSEETANAPCAHHGPERGCEIEPGGLCQPAVPAKGIAVLAVVPVVIAVLPDLVAEPPAAPLRQMDGGPDERQGWLAATSRFRERLAWPARAP